MNHTHDLDHLTKLAKSLRQRDTVRGRYAPSPTGALHLGNLRTALLAWLQCRLEQGALILRMEDLDEPRSSQEAADSILFDLEWLGLDWDEGPAQGGPCGPYTQSERKSLYDAVFTTLQAQGLVYPCFCSRRDIREAASAPHSGYIVYPGTCRNLRDPDLSKRHSWRWRLDDTMPNTQIHDQLTGAFTQNLPGEVGDFVVKRSDGIYAYQLAVVIDDALMGITDVLRGVDLLDSSPRQAMIFATMGWHTPRFWHAPLMHDKLGNRLSKRDGSQSLASLRTEGLQPCDVITKLAKTCQLLAPNHEPVDAQGLLKVLQEQGGIDAFRQALRVVNKRKEEAE